MIGDSGAALCLDRSRHNTVPCCSVGQKKAIIAFSRKLLKMIYILLEKGQYYDPNFAVKATE